MELKDIIFVGVETGNRVNYYWNFYVTVNIVVIGWLVSINVPLNYELKCLITLIYSIVVIVNALVLIREYQLMSALMEEIKARCKHEKFTTDILNSHVQKMSFKNRIGITIVLYSVFMLSILYLVWQIEPLKW